MSLDISLRDLARLRLYLLANVVAIWSAVLGLAALGVFVAPGSAVLWEDLAVMVACGLVLAGSLIVIKSGHPVAAAGLLVAACWTAAIGTTVLTPFLLPVGEMVVLLPVMIMFVYFPRRLLRTIVVGTVIAAATVGGLGQWRQYDQADFHPEQWVTIAVIGTCVPLLAAVLALGVRQNYDRLTEHAAQLLASRRRIVSAADQGRRTVERNLHDGAQQRLVLMSVQLGMLDRSIVDRPVASELVHTLSQELQEAIRELRELAHGIYPPLLAQRGLVVALTAAARRSPIPCTVELTGLARYSPEIESAVYFCCLEALQNAAKHSAAQEITLSAHASPDLSFTVADSGRGFEIGLVEGSSGLTGMQDRIRAAGGQLDIDSRLGVGTTVTGHFAALVG
jgi:signal transduction histidine kinase